MNTNEPIWDENIPRITSASFILTEQCNLNCTYCFEKEDKRNNTNVMTKDISEAAVEYLIKGAKVSKTNSIHITYFGGEPMLNLDVMNHSFDYALKRTKEEKISFDCMIITNATILTDKHMAFIKKWYKELGKINIQLSIDGIPSVQDKNRVKLDGSGSSDIVLKTIQKYLELEKELRINGQGMINVHSVISQDSVASMFESYKYFIDLGLTNIWFMPLHEVEWTEEEIEIYTIECQKIADYIYDKCKETGTTEWFHKYASLSRCASGHPDKPCGMGVTFATVIANGDVHPCHHTYFNDKTLKFGNVIDGTDEISKRQFFLDYTCESLFGDKPCAECDNHACYRCVAANYVNNGNFQIGFEQYCKISRAEDTIRKDLVAKLVQDKIMKDPYNFSSNSFTEENSQTIESLKFVIESIEASVNTLAKDNHENRLYIETLNKKIDDLIEINSGYIKLLTIMGTKIFNDETNE